MQVSSIIKAVHSKAGYLVENAAECCRLDAPFIRSKMTADFPFLVFRRRLAFCSPFPLLLPRCL